MVRLNSAGHGGIACPAGGRHPRQNRCKYRCMMFVLGLTGSIGMGKSTAARFFAEAGVPIHDADGAVHRLYEGEAAIAIEAAFPGTTACGKVDRAKLAERALEDPAAIRRLEAIIHPLVRESEAKFLAENAAPGYAVVALDLPLLFETRAQEHVDAVVVVSAGPQARRTRGLRPAGRTGSAREAMLAP